MSWSLNILVRMHYRIALFKKNKNKKTHITGYVELLIRNHLDLRCIALIVELFRGVVTSFAKGSTGKHFAVKTTVFGNKGTKS